MFQKNAKNNRCFSNLVSNCTWQWICMMLWYNVYTTIWRWTWWFRTCIMSLDNTLPLWRWCSMWTWRAEKKEKKCFGHLNIRNKTSNSSVPINMFGWRCSTQVFALPLLILFSIIQRGWRASNTRASW